MSAEEERLLAEDEIDLRKYLDIIWRRRNVLVWVTVVAVTATLAISLLLPGQWQAKTTVMVPEPPKVDQAQIVGSIQATTTSVVYSQETYARLLRSTVLSEAVVKKLNLSIAPEELASGISAKPIRDTRLIEITVRGKQPEQVEAIVNTLAEALAEYDRQVISAELTQAREFVQVQLAKTKKELESKEQILKEFNQKENLAAVEAELTRRLGQLTSLRQAYDQNKIELAVATRRLAQLKHELASTSSLRLSLTSKQTNKLDESVAAQLRSKLADLEVQRAILLDRYTSAHPSVVAINAQIQQARKELTQATLHEPRFEELQANTLRQALESQKATLEIEVAGMEAKDRLLSQSILREDQVFRLLNARLAEKRAELNRLTREADTAKNTYATISAKATEAVVAEGMKSGFVRVVDHAVARPVPRGTVARASIAVILGLLAGTMLAFVLEYFGVPIAAPVSPRTVPAANPSHRPET